MKAGQESGFCDIHCHILHGIDDGPKCLQQSVEMCRQAAADGVRTIVATPHFNDVYRPGPDEVYHALAELRKAVAEQQLPLEILPGADVAAGAYMENILVNRDYLTIGGRGKYVLFEPPHQYMPEWMNDIIFDLRLSGLGVIITHPERNSEVQREPAIILPLVESGVMVQVTAASIVGGFGREAKKCAAALLKMRAVHFIASDAHSVQFRPPRLWAAANRARKYVGDEAFKLICENPFAAVAGEAVEIPDPRPPVSWFGKTPVPSR